jgi:hypothetical protein
LSRKLISSYKIGFYPSPPWVKKEMEERVMAVKPKYYTKSVRFGSSEVTLYSLDGLTWSTRKDELALIQERHEAQKVTVQQLRGEPTPGAAAAPAEGQKGGRDAPRALPTVGQKILGSIVPVSNARPNAKRTAVPLKAVPGGAGKHAPAPKAKAAAPAAAKAKSAKKPVKVATAKGGKAKASGKRG